MKTRWGLWPYLFLTAAVSIAVGLGAVVYSVRQAAARDIQAYSHHRNVVLAKRVANTLRYLDTTKGWSGVTTGAQHFADLLDTPILLKGPTGVKLLYVLPEQSGKASPTPQKAGAVTLPIYKAHHRLWARVTLLRPPLWQPHLSPVLKAIQGSVTTAAVVGFLVALALSGLIGERVITPLKRISEGVRELAAGNLQHRVKVAGPEEVAELGDNFNRMATRLEEGEAERQQLIADVAHELRTPLSILQGYLESMRDGVKLPGPDPITVASEQTQHLVRLVDDLQELALADARQLSLQMEPLDVGELLGHLTEEWTLTAKRQQVSLQVRTPSEPARVLGDRQRLRQAIGNLLANAVKYTPEGGHVWVSGTVDGDLVKIVVEDTGPGIAPEHLAHVFDRLYRVDRSRSQRTGGSGLGLAIAKQLVDLHGGSIGVQSVVGTGSQFWIALPVAREKI